MVEWVRWIEYNNTIDEYRGQITGDFGGGYIYSSKVFQSVSLWWLRRKLRRCERVLSSLYRFDVRKEFVSQQWRNHETKMWRDLV